ncbi:MAG: sensor histidine kinase [Micrococcales bacterium]|nr:sensor histidine kinase [Micrococcales bacterium]
MPVLAEPRSVAQEHAGPGPDLPDPDLLVDPDSPGWVRASVTSAQLRNDVALALGLFALAVVEWVLLESLYAAVSKLPGWAVVLVITAHTVPLLARRRYPGTVLLVVTVAQLVATDREVYAPNLLQAALVVAFYTVGAWSPGRVRAVVVRVLAVVLGVGWLTWYYLSNRRQLHPVYAEYLDSNGGLVRVEVADVLVVILGNAIFVVAAWMYGNHAWASARNRDRVTWRTRQLAQAQLRGERQAVALERLRIARELHDAVAHHVAAMGVQAAVARRLVTSGQAAQGVESLDVVESSAKRAVAELGQILGMLRYLETDEPDVVSLGVERLPALVTEVQDAGLVVTYAEVGEPRALPVLVSLDLYRIAQEALTNACKHAGPTAKVAVRLRYLDAAVEIEVSDDGGGGRPLTSVPSTGLGLVGMRERVTAAGGTLHAAPLSRGGFVVRASLPVQT